MADLRKAAYMALEFLEHVDRFDPNGRYGLDEKIDALIQALAQAEQDHLSDAMSVLADVNADLIAGAKLEQDHGFDRTASHMAGEYVDTAPPSKPWVSLTDEQIELLWCEPEIGRKLLQFARAIESASKELNHG